MLSQSTNEEQKSQLRMLSQEEKAALRSIPLQEVMALNHHEPVRKVKNHYFYHCPLPSHDDSDPSFCVELTPSDGNQVAMFVCHGCKRIKGAGAIDLQAQLWGVKAEGRDYWRVVEYLAKAFNVEVQGVQNVHRHYETVDPVGELKWTVAEWTDELLKGLGCKVSPIFGDADDDDPQEATGGKAYSWAMVGEPWQRRPADDMTAERLGADITDRFGIMPLASFTTPQRRKKDGTMGHSYRVDATETYPIYGDLTYDQRGRWRMKKYEPLAKPDEKGNFFKWTWWYQGDEKRNPEFRHLLYGDKDVLDALYNKDVVPLDTSMLKDHPVTDVEGYDDDGQPTSTRKFRRVCICSGPRDALQVYYHSDCHVVYPHSESAEIDSRLIKRLFVIAEQVYILYDMDKTGREKARELNLEYLQLRNVELPEDLQTLTDRRTGKPAKDVSGYFELYKNRLGGRYEKRGIDAHFSDLLSRSIPIQFWERKFTRSNAEKAVGRGHFNYDLVVDHMKRFFLYSGFGVIEIEKGVKSFAKIGTDGRVELIQEEDVKAEAEKLMTEWLMQHPEFYTTKLTNRISSSDKMLSVKSLRGMHPLKLNLQSWGETWQYVPFRNGVLLVTADKLRWYDSYKDVPFDFIRGRECPISWRETDEEVRVEINPMFEEYERQHRMRLDGIDPTDERAMNEEEEQWTHDKVLWPFSLRMLQPMNKAAHIIQYIYDTGRMYWPEERQARSTRKDRWLSAERQQFQDMQFVSKMMAAGYFFSRYRTPSMSRILFMMDYTVDDESKACGGTGKSIFGSFLSSLGPNFEIGGKGMKTSPDQLAQNLAGYDYLMHNGIFSDELPKHTPEDMIYNWSEGKYDVKRLYKEQRRVPVDMAAKMAIACNYVFDLSSGSTRRRLWPLNFGNYYHDGVRNGVGTWTPAMKFGHDLIKSDDEDQALRRVNFAVRCLQLYFKYRMYVEAPVGGAGMKRRIYARFAAARMDKRFIEWADMLFANEALKGQPLPKLDLVVSWFQFTARDVNRDAVLNYAKGRAFGQMLDAYCQEMHISANPDVVYARPSDRGRLPRVTAYSYEFHPQTGRLTGRRLPTAQSCYYLYPRGEEPKDIGGVVTQQTADPAKEGYIME